MSYKLQYIGYCKNIEQYFNLLSIILAKKMLFSKDVLALRRTHVRLSANLRKSKNVFRDFE